MLPSFSSSLRSAIRAPCLRSQHAWLSGGIGAWVVCEHCGHMGVCKASTEGEKIPNVHRLPDIFCAAHDRPATRQTYRRAMTYPRIFARLVWLSEGIPERAWQHDASNPLSIKDLAWVQLPDYGVEYLHIRQSQGYWNVQVFALESTLVPVFHASGAYSSPRIHTVQAGAWMQAVLDTITLREGASTWR